MKSSTFLWELPIFSSMTKLTRMTYVSIDGLVEDSCDSIFDSLRLSDIYMHICISKLAIIGSDNGLSPGRRQDIIWTNAGMLIRTLGTNFTEILSEIHIFSFKKIHLKMLSGKRRPFCLGLNVLTHWSYHSLALSHWYNPKLTGYQNLSISRVLYSKPLIYSDTLLWHHMNTMAYKIINN